MPMRFTHVCINNNPALNQQQAIFKVIKFLINGLLAFDQVYEAVTGLKTIFTCREMRLSAMIYHFNTAQNLAIRLRINGQVESMSLTGVLSDHLKPALMRTSSPTSFKSIVPDMKNWQAFVVRVALFKSRHRNNVTANVMIAAPPPCNRKHFFWINFGCYKCANRKGCRLQFFCSYAALYPWGGVLSKAYVHHVVRREEESGFSS